MLLRSERGGSRVLSRNADERSLRVERHKDPTLPAHWLDLGKWKRPPFVLTHSKGCSEAASTSTGILCFYNVRFEARYDSPSCHVLCCVYTHTRPEDSGISIDWKNKLRVSFLVSDAKHFVD